MTAAFTYLCSACKALHKVIKNVDTHRESESFHYHHYCSSMVSFLLEQPERVINWQVHRSQVSSYSIKKSIYSFPLAKLIWKSLLV